MITTLINQLAIRYDDRGAGPVILMLHGWQDSLSTFDALTDVLTRSFRVIRLDLPGHGHSQLPPPTWRLDDFVRLVADFIAQQHLDVQVLVGHSFGGRIAIQGVAAGALQPQRLILIAAAGLREPSLTRSIIAAAAKVGKIVTALPFLRRWRHGLRRRLYRQAGSDYLTAGDLQPIFLNIVRTDLTSAARQIGIPTLLCWGSADTETPLHQGQALARLISNSELTVVDGATHFVHREHPDVIAARIEAFAGRQ